MPITKLPIVHKFGIISQTQREELQDRLIKQTYHHKGSRVPVSTRNPTELTEAFIQEFNNADGLEDKERLEELAYKMLSRAQRRAGLKQFGRGNYVDLPRAWSELSMLAQCRGKIQEECLDTLIVSLHQASLSTNHIPSLFYLAETTLYWLRTDAMDQPFLRIGEIKLLKMGLSVFLRLFYHHMVGHLSTHTECKQRLITYLAGIKECEEAYNPYPGAHLCLRFISEVGSMVVGDVLGLPLPLHTPETRTKDPNQILEEEEPPESPINASSPITQQHSHHDNTKMGPSPFQSSIHDLSPALWHTLDVWRCVVHLSKGFKDAVKALSLCATSLSTEHWVDAVCAMRVLSEAAKSNITVLRAMQNLAKGVIPATSPLPMLGHHHHHYPDAIEADVDAESIKSGQTSLSGFQSAGVQSADDKVTDSMIKLQVSEDLDMPGGLESEISLGGKRLSDLSGHSFVKGNASMQVMVGSPHAKSADQLTTPSSYGHKTSLDSTPTTMAEVSSRESLESAGDLMRQNGHVPEEYSDDSDLEPGDTSAVSTVRPDVTQLSGKSAQGQSAEGAKFKREVSFDIDTVKKDDDDGDVPRKSSIRMDSGVSDRKSSSAKSVTIDPIPNTAYYANTTTPVADTNKHGKATKPYSNKLLPDVHGIQAWSWELGFTYVEIMANMCLYSTTSNIQKLALIGDRKDAYVRPTVSAQGKRNGVVLESAGLLDMAEFHASNDGSPEDGTDWSWRIRYAAILGLVKITRCSQDNLHEGLRTVAWNALMRCHTKERDERVLEAFRVGQVEAQLEVELQKTKDGTPLNARLAAGLAVSYLPPLAPAVKVPTKPTRRKVELPKAPEPRKGANRLSLRQELMLSTAFQETPVNFVSRTSYDLKRIVEDQWRKELQQKLEEEEKDKQQELEEEQKKTEERQKEVDEKKKRKFEKHNQHKGEVSGPASPTLSDELSPRESLSEVDLNL
ncbi:uncharacterized protein [Amphiura filiformis]|uniref:uncharacterized protein isoform X2 n=1 Tax=Amphiura filiformis TaxID=82378 RepID=UPI003B2257FA